MLWLQWPIRGEWNRWVWGEQAAKRTAPAAVAAVVAVTTAEAAVPRTTQPIAATPAAQAGGGGGSSYAERKATNLRFWQGWENPERDGLVVLSWQ